MSRGAAAAQPVPPEPRTGSWAPVAVVALLAATAAAVLYLAAASVGPTGADVAALAKSIELRSPGLTAVAVFVTNAGSTASMSVLAVVVGAWALWRRRWADAALAIGAMVGAAALFRILKVLIDRPRPPTATRLVAETNQSLPSGHATMSMAVIGMLVVLAWGGRSIAGRVVIVAVATLWIGAVGATRIYLGVHWFTDVLAGWLVGATWLAICVLVWSHWSPHVVGKPRSRSGSA